MLRTILLATVLVIASFLSDSPTYAQGEQPYRTVVEQLTETRAELASVKEQIQEVLAKLSGLTFKDIPRDVQKQTAQSLLPSVESAKNKLAQLPDGVIPNALKKRIQDCGNALMDSSKIALSGGDPDATKLIASCSKAELDDLKQRLIEERDQGRQSWENCRDVIVSSAGIDRTALPPDPTRLPGPQQTAVVKNIDQIAGRVAGEPKLAECAKTMADAAKKIFAAEDAMSALGDILAFAGPVCAASGGNPVVCGGMVVLAALLKLFSKDGGGGGTGKAQGPGDQSNVGRGRMAEVPKAGTPADGPGSQLWGKDPKGDLYCKRNGTKLVCSLNKDLSNAMLIDPANTVSVAPEGEVQALVRNSIAANRSEDFIWCRRPDPVDPAFLVGFALLSGNNFYPIGLAVENKNLSDVRMSFQKANSRDGKSESQICAVAFP